MIWVLFKIAFAQTGILALTRTVVALAWMFLLPGYCLMLSWRHQLSLLERITLGIGIQVAMLGILSYYLVLLGWSLQNHGFILPFASIAVGIALEIRQDMRRMKHMH